MNRYFIQTLVVGKIFCWLIEMVNPKLTKNISVLVLSLILSGILSWIILEILHGFIAPATATLAPIMTTAVPITTASVTPVATTRPPGTDLNGFYGPFGKSWSEVDCPVIGTPVQTGSLDECEKICLANDLCNVINRKVDGTGVCRLHQCPVGKKPNNYDSLSKGYSLYPGAEGW